MLRDAKGAPAAHRPTSPSRRLQERSQSGLTGLRQASRQDLDTGPAVLLRAAAIAACSMTEAPVAFRNGTESERAPYEIRAFEKKLRWPVLDGNYGFVNADEFLNGLAIGGTMR
jgi:hypothetical protein